VRGFNDLPGPHGLPLLGNAHQVRVDQLHLQLEEWSEEYGSVFKLRFGTKRVVATADPSLIDQALRQRPQHYRRPGLAARISSEMGRPTGLFFAEGEIWERQRRMVSASFAAEPIRAYFPRLQQVTSRLMDKWSRAAETGATLDLSADLKRYTVDVIAGLAFGVDVNSVENDVDEIQSHIDFIFAMSFRRSLSVFPYWRYVSTSAARRLTHSVRVVNESIERFINEAARRRQRAEFKSPSNLLEAMLCEADQPGSDITRQDIAGNVAAMLFAGEDSPASTLAWTLALLEEHPKELARCRAEAMAIDPEGNILSLDQLQRLTFLDACLREAMRLKPVAPFIALESLGNNNLGDVRVPCGTLVLCLTRHAGLAEVGGDRCFDPNRWIDHEDGQSRKLKTTVRSFGAGRRMCPGRYLALLEMKSVISALLRNFEILAIRSPHGTMRETMSVTMNPGPLEMSVRRVREPLPGPKKFSYLDSASHANPDILEPPRSESSAIRGRGAGESPQSGQAEYEREPLRPRARGDLGDHRCRN
jgi:cytochrome P450